jgi:class 3 adenylate cyclase
LDPLLAGHQVGIDNGDFFYGNLALLYKVIYAYWISQELRSLEKEMAQDLQIMQQFKQLIPLEITETCYHMVLNLINPVEKPYELSKAGYDEAVVLDRFIQMKNQTALFILYTNKGVLAYLFNELESALHYFNLAEEHIVSVPGFLVAPNFHFYDALTRLALYVQASEAERQTHLEKVQADQDALQKWNEFAPQNYQHKVRLIEAVHAQVFGQESVVRELYDDAIILAQEGEYLCEEALASELAAQFYVQKKRKHVARHYMRDAVYAYLRWGALAKVQQLEKQYPDLLAQTASSAMLQSTTTMSTMMTMSTRTSHGIVALDFMTVLKASQMLAGEIKLDRLMINLMQVVIENAGAERGLLLLQKQGQWVIEAEGEVGKEEITVLQSIPIQNLLPLSIINYVTNTRQSVVLNDAMNEEEFAQDNYVRKCQPKSVLCIPLLNQGKLQGILYLENNLTTGAFTPDRIEILNLLSTQAAISIENASLYGHQVALTDSYGRFVPIDYLKFLHKERIMDVNLGDHVAKEMAVMFSDIRSFTSISETMSPQENFNFVNAYLKRVSPPIRINNGLIVKYIGDGIMAIFPNGADDAIRAGIGKLKQIEQYNIERQQEDRRPIKIGVGIHVGHMMVGMVGEVARMQGDAFSDNVNLTSRLEGLTKFYGTSLIVSEETLSNLENPSCYQMRYLDRVIVKGRSKPITIFEVLDGEPEQIMNFKLETQAYFEKGMRRYQARDFTEALFHFNEVLSVYPDDKAAILYLERSTRFAREGVPSDWEGITVMTEK